MALNDPRLSNPSQDAEDVQSGFFKITQRAMVKKRSWVNMPVCPCLHSSLTHHRNINPFANKVWEIHIFIKKYVRSFIDLRKSWVYNMKLYHFPRLKYLDNCLHLETIYLCGLYKEFSSVLILEFYIKHLKKPEGHIGRNVVSIWMKTINRIF